MSEAKQIRVMSEDDSQNAEIDKLRERVEKLEKWQSFMCGVSAATGAFVGVGLTLASILMGK